MNNVDYEIVNPDPAGTTASLSSLNVPADLDAEWNVDVREPLIAVRGHLRRIGVAAYRLAKETLRHRGRIAAAACSGDLPYTWTMTRDNGQLTCGVNRDHPLARQVTCQMGPDNAARRSDRRVHRLGAAT